MQITKKQAEVLKMYLYEQAEQADCTASIPAEKLWELAGKVCGGSNLEDFSANEQQVLLQGAQHLVERSEKSGIDFRSLQNLVHKLNVV